MLFLLSKKHAANDDDNLPVQATCTKYCARAVDIFGANSNIFSSDSNVKSAENPFINILPRCMRAILDPERATECF